VDVKVANPDGGSATVAAGFTYGTVAIGCGTDCGNVGDPYEGRGGPPASATQLSSCDTNLAPTTPGQYFLVTQNVGSNPAAACFDASGWAGNVSFILDLGGHTVTGGILISYNTPGPITIFNGTITCNNIVGGPEPTACLHVYNGLQWQGQFRAHHLTINQQNTTASTAAVFVVNDNEHAALTFPGNGLGLELRLDHISVTTPASNPVNTRFNSLRVQSYVNAEADYNYVHCLGGINGCQGIIALGVPLVAAHNNLVIMDYNTTAQDGRAFLCDWAGLGPGNSCDIYANDITSTNNRAIRYRGANSPIQNGSAHDNIIRDIRAGGRLAAVHFGENDTDLSLQNISVYSNTFEIHDGNGVAVSSASGISIYNNTAICFNDDCSPAGYFARTDSLGYDGNGTNINAKNNTSALTSASKPSVFVCGLGQCTSPTSTTSATVCSTGAAAGNGTITTLTPPCP
jgi:hypothetical protein